MHYHQTYHLQLEVHEAAGTEFGPSLGIGVVLLELAMWTRKVRARHHHRRGTAVIADRQVQPSTKNIAV